MTKYLSLSEENQFCFTCPVFNARTKMAACTTLRELVWRGERVEKRRGCQVAMKSGMCPAAAMVSLYSYNKNWDNDFHSSDVEKDGKLHAQVLEKIVNKLPMEKLYHRYEVAEAEIKLLETANDRIEQQLKTAPGERLSRAEGASHTKAGKRRKAAAAPKQTVPTEIQSAAASGDMSAAINQE